MSACLVSLSQAAEYNVVDLGAGLAFGLSAEGQVVGSVSIPEQTAAILAPTPQVLGTLADGLVSLANGVAQGRVVGYTTLHGLLQQHAFLYTQAGGMQDLGTLGDASLVSVATAINSAQLITGYGERPDVQTIPAIRPIVFVLGIPSEIGTLGGPTGYADTVNEMGDICGQSQTVAGDYHATLWPLEGGVIDLDQSPGSFSLATSLNNHGQIVGALQGRAHLWHGGPGGVDLGVFPGDISSRALGINDAGMIVGVSTPGGPCCPPERAVRFTDGQVQDLTALIDAPGWSLELATAINNAGQISGVGRLNGQSRAFLLQPIAADPPPHGSPPVTPPPQAPPPTTPPPVTPPVAVVMPTPSMPTTPTPAPTTPVPAPTTPNPSPPAPVAPPTTPVVATPGSPPPSTDMPPPTSPPAPTQASVTSGGGGSGGGCTLSPDGAMDGLVWGIGVLIAAWEVVKRMREGRR